MADLAEFHVKCAPADTLGFAQQALAVDGFRITAQTELSCIAEKGSTKNRALAGGFAERSIVKLSAFDGGPGVTLLRIEKHGSGWSGGYLGAQKAKKGFKAATERLGSSLQEAGLLA